MAFPGLEYERTTRHPISYTSFSGTDISAQMLVPNESTPLDMGELQTISYSMHRESVPVRVLGRVNPLGFTRGPRCIPASERVYVKGKGLISISDVKEGDLVHSFGDDYNKVLGSYNQGFKLCYNLQLKNGHAITASHDHPILTDRGWVKVEDLTEGDLVATAGLAPSHEQDLDISDDSLRLIAYLIGDGFLMKRAKPSGSIEHRISLSIAYTELDTIGIDSAKAISSIGATYRDIPSHHGGCMSRKISVCLEGHAKTDWKKRKYNDLHFKLQEYGLYGLKSYEKVIPDSFMYGLSSRQISLFLKHLYSTDGHYSLEKSGRLKVVYTSTSEVLIDQIRFLLLKLGITSSKRLKVKAGKVGGKESIVSRHDAWSLEVTDNINVQKFYSRIGIFGKDERVASSIKELRYKTAQPLSIDPKLFLKHAQQAILESGKKLSDFKRFNIFNYNLKLIAPKRAFALAKVIDNLDFTNYVESLVDELIEKDNPIVFQPVSSVEKGINLQVYDLEVEDRHQFVCENIYVHNTIAGSMIFTVFNIYPFYRLAQYKELVRAGTGQSPLFPLADMLPPFDVVLTFSNEYGQFARMKITGMVIVDEGGVMSIEDLITESTFTFMANGIIPLTPHTPGEVAYIENGVPYDRPNIIGAR